FFGVNRVELTFKPSDPIREKQSTLLHHGRIVHGAQFRDPALRREPTTYYWRGSGIGLAMKHQRELARAENRGLRVGVVGLGVGVLASDGEAGDSFRMYEIDPDVIRLAKGEGGYLTFIKDSPAQVEIVEGDARTSLEAELRDGRP